MSNSINESNTPAIISEYVERILNHENYQYSQTISDVTGEDTWTRWDEHKKVETTVVLSKDNAEEQLEAIITIDREDGVNIVNRRLRLVDIADLNRFLFTLV